MRKSHDGDSHSTCSAVYPRKRGLARFSLRRLLCSSPLIARRFSRAPSSASRTSKHGGQGDVRSGPSRDFERGDPIKVSVTASSASPSESLPRATSKVSVQATGSSKSSEAGILECPLCLTQLPNEYFPDLSTCHHRSCYDCFQTYLRIEISESRVGISCPECAEAIHPNDIRMILNDKSQYEKYEDFMVRRVLAVDPDTRWCPAPDCSYAVIAAGCASCPKIKCERPGCDSFFCYHCKAEWHPNQTCDAARAQRSPNVRSSSISFSQDSQHRDDIKPCPRCQMLIVKMDDGSCNHMTCAVCAAEFCWLCMKEISDLHYLSPSGCTFWGKKPWSRKKKILWQLGTLVGAPVGIGLVAGIAVPVMIIGIPVWVGRKLYARYEHTNKHKRNLAIAGAVTASILVSPILAGLAVGIGVPILLFYVYGVVPVSLCRSGGCGVSTTSTGVRFDFDDENDLMGVLSPKNTDAVSMDAVSHRGVNPSIGEVSLSLGSGSQLERLGRENDRESASNVALAGASLAGASLAGSIASSVLPCGQRLEVQADVASTQRFSMSSETASAATSLSEKSVSASIADDGGASTRALAGSVLNFKTDSSSLSGYRGAMVDGCTPVEVHADSASQRSDEAAGPASLSSLEELAVGHTRRLRRRTPLDRQGSESSCWTTGAEDGVSERVRFDDHVSFIAPPQAFEDDDLPEVERDSTNNRTGRKTWMRDIRSPNDAPTEDSSGKTYSVAFDKRSANETHSNRSTEGGGKGDEDNSSTVTINHTNSDSGSENAVREKPITSPFNGNKLSSSGTLRNLLFHSLSSEKRHKSRKSSSEVSTTPLDVDGSQQQTPSRPAPSLPVIPEPSVVTTHVTHVIETKMCIESST